MDNASNTQEIKKAYLDKPWLKLYPPELPPEIDLPSKSVPQAFDEAAEKFQDRTALSFYGNKIKYKELKNLVDKFASTLYDLGVKKNDIVALHMLNCPQFVIAFLAAAKIGATITPISPVYVTPEIKHQLEDSGAETLVGQDILFNVVEQAGVPLKNIILTSIDEYLPGFKKAMGKSILRSVYQKMSIPNVQLYDKPGIHKFQDLLKKYSAKPPQVDINVKEDIFLLPYTGGTTALPKAAMLTHFNIIAQEILVNSFQSTRFGPGKKIHQEGKEVFAAYAPFYHIMGLNSITQALFRGQTMIIFTTPDLDDIFTSIVSDGITQFGGAPTIFDMLKDYEKTNRIDWKRMTMLRSGADALHEETATIWEKRTGTQIDEVYGLSETSPIVCMSPIGRRKIGSFGIPIQNTSVAIIDPETKDFAPLGEVGEIIVKGPIVFKGYWKRPEETKNCFIEIDGEQWFRTGDLGRMDEEGYFYFYDRKRDRIKYKGYSVFAREVEEVLKAHPQIKDAGVIGVPDPKVGENVKAVIVLEREARGKLSEEDIMKYCEGRMAHYKCPRIIEFRGEVPKTDVGKVSRRELREELA
mgnify:CR=1 FL=1